MLGIALVDKPTGISSHDAIYKARRALGIRKIGHAGTLDPAASGLLVMAIGEATRFLPYLQADPKTYTGEGMLGVTTTTQDADGEVVERHPVKTTVEELRDAAGQFVGEIEQVPPMYSAVQIAGQRLYKLARRGEEVERQPRRVRVVRFEVPDLRADRFAFEVVCSAGTYVRTLIHDLGAALDVGAHLTSLRRVASGRFSVADAAAPEALNELRLISLEEALNHVPFVRLPSEQTERAAHGNEFVYAAEVSGDLLGLLDDRGVFAVCRQVTPGVWRPERALPPP